MILIRLLFLLLIYDVKSEIISPTEWSVSKNEVGDNNIELVFTSKIKEGWYLYSSDFDTGLGPIVTSFFFQEDASYSKIGKIIPISPKSKYDSLWGGVYTYFIDTGVFIQRVVIEQPKYKIKTSVSYQVCSEIDGKCISGEEDFIIEGSKKTMDSNSSGIGFFALYAFLWGIAAIFTPCVFPMIPLTVSYFSNNKSNHYWNKRGGSLLYGLSIIFIYTIFGSVIAPIAGPTFANIISTHWIPNTIFFIVFILFAFSFWGMFDIVLPSSLITKMDSLSQQKSGLIGIFFMAFTLVLVSFSCTGPIVGTILVSSAGGNILKPIVGMIAFFFCISNSFHFV